MDSDVLHPQWGRSGRQDLLQLLRSVRGTQEPRRRTGRGSAYWGAAEIVRGGAEPPPMVESECDAVAVG
jgi:hypothetical protein